MKYLTWAVLVLGVAAAPASAQVNIAECGTYKDRIQSLVTRKGPDGADLTAEEVDRTARGLASVQNNVHCFAVFVADRITFIEVVKRFESSRSDKETGAATAGGSGPSVVSQGPAARVLSAAVDFGALTRGVDGQVVTLKGNLAGLPAALARKDVFPYCPAGLTRSGFCVEQSLLSWLRRTTFSVSFDANRGTQAAGTPTGASTGAAQEVTFAAKGNQVSAASARVELWNKRDVTNKDFQTAWGKKVAAAMAEPAADLSKAGGDFILPVINELPGYNDWLQRTGDAILKAAPDRNRIVESLTTGLEELRGMLEKMSPDIRQRATTALSAYSRFFLAQDELIDPLATKTVVAVEYQYAYPQGKPITHHVRVILDWPMTKTTKLVANGGVTRYKDLPAGSPSDMSKTRDGQFAVQVEHSLGRFGILGPAAVVGALYYQYQNAASVLKVDPAAPLPGITFTDLPDGAKAVFTNTGNIVLGQGKLVLSPPGSSVKIPIAVTLSNRTELIDKPTWKAQIGVSYDFDSLLGLLQ